MAAIYFKSSGMMLASLFQFSFLFVVTLANFFLGFAIASHLGWGPPLAALFHNDHFGLTKRRAASDQETTARESAERTDTESDDGLVAGHRNETRGQADGAAARAAYYQTPEA